MRLFGKIDGAVNRFDRAQWLSAPFDRPFAVPVAAVPDRTFAAPPRGTTFESIKRGTCLAASPRGVTFDPGQN